MKHFEVRRVIAAPDRVWATLTNAEALVSGGLGITRLDGSIADGAAQFHSESIRVLARSA